MKFSKIKSGYIFGLLLTGILLFSCKFGNQKQQATTGAYYTCAMHSQIHENKPGNCPICGMKLILVSRTKKAEPIDSSMVDLVESATQTIVGSFKVIEPIKSNPADIISANGYIGFDERGLNTVSLRISGRIEKLFVHYINQHIQKGQPLMTVYSPELLSAQRDLLQALHLHDLALITSLKKNLLNLGMADSEIQQVIETKLPITAVTIYSPFSGILIQPEDAIQNGTMTNTRNTSMTEDNTLKVDPAESISLRQGMYIAEGQTLFFIQDIQQVWAILNIFNSGIWQIKTGDPVDLSTEADPKKVVRSSIDFIPPYQSLNGHTSQVKIYLNKVPAGWKIGSLIHGDIMVTYKTSRILIPLLAVNRLGLKDVVWVQDAVHADVFHARQIKTGLQTGDSVELLSGIQAGEKIAANAAYMTGSESFIQ